jgi:predicted nucleic acid-binding protein
MTTSSEAVTLTLLDTNVLVYALDAHSAHHAASRALVFGARNGDAGLCVAPQNLAEFYAVVTDRRRVCNPQEPAAAAQVINELLALPGLALLPVPVDIVGRFVELLQRNKVSAQHAFDAFLVATMLGNGVRHICTFNRSDFEAFAEIIIAVPSTAATP